MQASGQRAVDAAKADGRWAKAYGGGRNMPLPPDLQAAIDAVPRAQAMLATLDAKNCFALAFRVHKLKTDGRAQEEDRRLRGHAGARRVADSCAAWQGRAP
jgi:uncharacterized protein YdeI (YjbR/CyaY-like superfamily)